MIDRHIMVNVLNCASVGVLCVGDIQSAREHEQKITEQREKQLDLINQLKSQLEDLETYAYEVVEVFVCYLASL